MKRLNVIISIAIVMTLIAGSVFAMETTKDVDRAEGAQFLGMRGRGMMGMGQERMMGRAGGMQRGRGGRSRRGGRGTMMGGSPAMLRLADKLDLSETQRTELSGIHDVHRKDMIRQKAECDLARVDLGKLMREEEPNMDAVREQLMTVAALGVDMKCSQIKVKADSMNVLTEKQREALKKIQETMRAGRAGGRRGFQGRAPQDRGPRDRGQREGGSRNRGQREGGYR